MLSVAFLFPRFHSVLRRVREVDIVVSDMGSVDVCEAEGC